MHYKQANVVINEDTITIYVSYPLPGQPDFHERLSRKVNGSCIEDVAHDMLEKAGFTVDAERIKIHSGE